MRITSVNSATYRLPLRERWMSAKYAISHHELVVTEIETEGGLRGIGWCTTVGMGGLAVETLVRAYLAPTLIGQDARRTAGIWEALWQDCHFLGPGGASTLAIATIDIALWDLKAKAANLPLYLLLGGARDSVGVYASAVNLHLSEDALLAQVEEHLRLGYEVFKIKIGRRDPEEDLSRIRAIRRLLGPSRTLLLDVNQKWQAGEAVQRCRAFAEMSPGWIEEPILSDDVEGHRLVRHMGGVPVAVGEQLCNRFEFWNYVRAGAADVLQPNVWKVGGITEWMRIAALAQSANLLVAPHNALELSVHLVAAIPNGFMAENIFGGNLHDLGAATSPLSIVGGQMALSNRPGHGVEMDGGALQRFRLDPSRPVERDSTVHGGL